MPAWPLPLVWPLLVQPLAAGEHECPPAHAVDARVRTILGLESTEVLSESAEVGREGRSLRITLRSADGQLLGDRSLTADGTCDELAGVAAVVLATWLSDVHPEFVGALPRAEPSPAPLPLAPAASDKGLSSATKRPADDALLASEHYFAFAAAAGGAFSRAKPVPMGIVGARYLAATSGFGWSLAASLSAPHDQVLGSGNVHYWRWPLSTGPVLRLALEPVALELHAGAGLAWLHLQGESFERPETRDMLLGAIVASTRVSPITNESAAFAPFVEVTGVGWPGVRPYLSPSSREVVLPRFELFLALGASVTAR